MIKLPESVIGFFESQGFVVVSTIDANGSPHSACKGIVKIDPAGRVYILDLYRGLTYRNLTSNARLSITAIDEHKFKGYCLKGKGRAAKMSKLSSRIISAWESKLTGRITQRIIRNIHEEKGHPRHPEAFLPKPEYMIVLEVEEIVNLTPNHIV